MQELLAPCELEFYAADWMFLGTRSDHCSVLSQIAGIHRDVLGGMPSKHFSIAQRMSWASLRVTTRPEDIAYCLLGLFDVNLPLLYREGGRKAFIRLQEEIMRSSDDHSLFAWTQSHVEPQKMHGLLADSPADFALAANIVPYGNPQVSNPFSVTNSGLQITLPITQISGPGYSPPSETCCFAFLDCIDVTSRHRCVELRLIRPRAQGDQYARYDLNEIWSRDIRTKVESHNKTIFVRSSVEDLSWSIRYRAGRQILVVRRYKHIMARPM